MDAKTVKLLHELDQSRRDMMFIMNDGGYYVGEEMAQRAANALNEAIRFVVESSKGEAA